MDTINNAYSKKYSNVILFLCKALGGSIVGKKKLYKLLYYIDFDNYEYKESMRSITGSTYSAWKMGPVPVDGEDILSTMEKAGLLEKTEQHISDDLRNASVYTAKKDPDMSLFSEDEKFIMERVVKKYGQLNGRQLEILTHNEAPYIATNQNEPIDYELAFYRGTVFEDELYSA